MNFYSKRFPVKPLFLMALISLVSYQCTTVKHASTLEGPQSQIIRKMIEAVNKKDADQYVADFAETVQVYVDHNLKVDGRPALKANRRQHFANHPAVRSEIQYLLEIDNKVIMHDKVWLKDSDETGQDIVEIFTFAEGKVVRVDVIQSRYLFQ